MKSPVIASYPTIAGTEAHVRPRISYSYWCNNVNRLAKVSLKILSTLLMAGAASCVGFVLTRVVYVHWFVPGLMRESPHDGQIGLAGFVTALYGACIFGVVALCFGFLWTVRTSRRSAS